MKMKFLALSAAVALSTSAFAQSPSWDLVEVGVVKVDIDDIDEVSPTGIAFGGSKLLGEDVFITGSYSSVTDEFEGVDLDIDRASVGIGYRYGVSETTDAYVKVSYVYVELSASGNGVSDSIDDNGYGVGVGVRSRLSSKFEVDGSIGYVSIDGESDTALGLGGYYYFNEAFAAGAHFATSADVNNYGVSLRYSF